jgi:formylglycine-generating enzyme required for sulfatase activity
LTVPVKAKATPPAKVKTVYVVKNNDRDGDGLSDEIDECPDEKGSPKNNGCPEKMVIEKKIDRDGDGLSDEIDNCPDEKGIPQNNGCPEKTISIPLPEMIVVAGGSFTMGSKNNYDDEKPLHNVTLSSFSMAKTETTVAQWRLYCTTSGKGIPEAPSWGWNENDPIVNVSWGEAVAYCNWLTKRTGKSYRLPTEAEWEYAARGGNKSNGYDYAGGDDLTGVGWSKENSTTKAHGCGLKRSNELGLYDMSGNVWEWCMDWYDRTYYANSSSKNPRGPSSGSIRVLRGGSWDGAASNCRVAIRNGHDIAHPHPDYGFRVVLSQ